MKKAYFIIIPIILKTILVGCLPAQIAESPWPIFMHDPSHTGLSPYSGPGGPDLKWRLSVKKNINNSVVIDSDGTIYLSEGFYALYPNGSLKWTYDGGHTSVALGGDGTIYYGSGMSLIALDSDGTFKWSFPASELIGSSPAIGIDGSLYFGSTDGSFYAVNPDGTEKWQYTAESGILSSPAVDKFGNIYFNDLNGSLYSLKMDGSERWKFTGSVGTRSSPSIGEDNTIYTILGDYLFAVYPDGSERWQYWIEGGAETTPAIGSDGTIYVGGLKGWLYAIKSDGTLKWKFPAGDWIYSSPAVDAAGTIYVCSKDMKCYAISPNGSFKWTYKTNKAIYYSSAVIGENETLYFGSNDGYLYALGEFTAPTQTFTPSPTMTTSPTPTISATPTQTSTPHLTPTPTLTITGIPTATPTITWADSKPNLLYGKVIPESGYLKTNFEYLVYYKNKNPNDNPPLKRIYIDDKYRTMSLKSGKTGDGWYNFYITGYELSPGNHDFFFQFVDQGGGAAQSPAEGKFNGPLVYLGSTPTETPTPTTTLTPTVTPTPPIFIKIASPEDFYYNTILLSWNPVPNAAYYEFECQLPGGTYSFPLADNWLRLIVKSYEEWEYFVGLGKVYYRVRAYDSDRKVIVGPTDFASFVCLPLNGKLIRDNPASARITDSQPSGYLQIASPPDFYFNTLLLSWTPIEDAAYYQIEYISFEKIYSAIVNDHFVRLTFPDQEKWGDFVSLGDVIYRVSAYNEGGYRIEGPTSWKTFVCY